ncbi:hypothetical protein ACJMK2_016682 [Sinanodonta woodiana]|uniref:C1q domain-containing protein n=1 Tax=Sinanodonta woodiana TaxID=1069815 RepID=A0ABD3UXU5_SINWO
MLSFCCLLLLATFTSHNMAILEKTGEADLDAVRIRLEEEKAKRLLLQNDVEVLMLQVEELKRGFSQISKDKMAPSGNLTLITPSIAFTVTSLQTANLFPEQSVIFDTVNVNEGSCYNASTGRFRAPFSGLYIFSLTVLRINLEVQLLIMKDKDELVSVFFGRSESDSGSGTIVTLMDKGETAYVKEVPGGRSQRFFGSYWITFTGLLHVRY